jgi:hypothetical protein
MKTLHDYINTIKKTYNYRLKFAIELEDEHFSIIESILQKYNLVDVSNVYKTPIQKNPLDFPTLSVAEVLMMDIETEIPMSLHSFTHEFSQAARISTDFIHVRNDSSPYNAYEQQIIDYQEKPYVVKLTDPHYESDGVEDQQLYGDEYNKELVKTILADRETKSTFKSAIEEFKSKSMFSDVKN